MPLSDHERALLAEMEQALSADDPRLVSALTGTRLYPGRPRILTGLALVVSGLVILFAGLIIKTPALGIVGFMISLVGLISVISGFSGMSTLRAPKKARKPKFGSRLEDRWERRNFDR
ncbi:unannotated protein [freshwater metagenome]|uniref:Unannotated protein n=1 Tax=freshwater metagenome TaxID=449393 RepID=A0A6J6XJ75_9ZZZZ|nr:DUF3040 domain-containing protein [Actinomycetota bacterium]MSV86242.1 DUF3040 domain-containing protein [Actinomycetota bacterium]MSW67459.1 DUF3040 domain-containing protein [Actinomycetota bacterium]MSX28162.1 DUF3040 domain-containing protein [Actinomycetota bacterium]MSY03265.1 DUF3040 domain-containing protein [Actinomycetota bacterium]